MQVDGGSLRQVERRGQQRFVAGPVSAFNAEILIVGAGDIGEIPVEVVQAQSYLVLSLNSQ